MRWAMPRVLPLPAPARTRSGPSVWTTASCWAGFSPARISSGTRPRPSPPFTAPSPTPAATAASVLDPPPQEPPGEGQHDGRPARRAPQDAPPGGAERRDPALHRHAFVGDLDDHVHQIVQQDDEPGKGERGRREDAHEQPEQRGHAGEPAVGPEEGGESAPG